ncbi:Paraquat-inducible protein A [Novymonas esmeraldas]|uniref:Paraquat-inducible protein A n=1 Tax=Novymonas esmeraldas TaxID=1808958 RepID=A0AAW0EWA7_9TRYP
MDVQGACLTTALLLNTLYLSVVPIPNFNESLLGVHAFNLSCVDVHLGGVGASWLANTSYAGTTDGGAFRCRANVTAHAYSGVVWANVSVRPSEVRLTRTAASLPDSSLQCLTGASKVDACSMDAAVEAFYAEPPDPLIDLVLSRLRESMNQHLSDYVCKVLVPRVQAAMMNNTFPFQPPPTDSGERTMIDVTASPLLRAAMTIARRLNISGTVFTTEAQRRRVSVGVFLRGPPQARYAGAVVPALPWQSAVDWAQGLVDAYVEHAVPHPFPVYGLPEGAIDLVAEWNASVPVRLEFDVDFGIASSADNWVALYRDAGVSIANLRVQWGTDGLGTLTSLEIAPQVEALLNSRLAALLRSRSNSSSSSSSSSSDSSSSNDGGDVVRLSMGKNAVVHDAPLVLPLLAIGVVGCVAGALVVARNLRLHATQPVLCMATGSPISPLRLVAEDACLIGGALLCALLFAASNTMTGATVVLGDELHTYAFSLWNTVTDLWQAGLIPLSVCVFVFSGVYPYVKLVSLAAFTVCAHRPESRALAVIDYLGKLSLIDTFALMVMVSGLEIPYVADVVIHRSFYLFLSATILSIALGNYATQLWRAGTSLRCEGHGSTAGGGGGGYVAVAAEDVGDAAAPLNPPPVGTLLPRSSPGAVPRAHFVVDGQSPWRRRAAACVTHAPALALLACSVPAWLLPSLRYRIGGFARLLTPDSKALSLSTLSTLNGRRDAQAVHVVALFTILVAPVLYVALYPRCAFLASWCAADVLVIACVAGLLQLHQFVTFVLGDGMNDVYTARATLLWPMLLVAAGALLVWGYIARTIRGGGRPCTDPTRATSPA